MRSTTVFGLSALAAESRRSMRRLASVFIKKNKFERNPELIESIYDNLRRNIRQELDSLTLEDYCNPHKPARWILYDNKIHYGRGRDVRSRRLDLISSFVSASGFNQIVELGSGDGSNLIYLARHFPRHQFLGIELSSESVALSNEAKAKFNVENVRFVQADLSIGSSYESLVHQDQFVFTLHCFEEMPRIFVNPLDVLKQKQVKSVLLLEPAYIFNASRFFLDLARLLRIWHHDRLWGLVRSCRQKFGVDYDIQVVDLGIGNPVNPTSLVALRLKRL